MAGSRQKKPALSRDKVLKAAVQIAEMDGLTKVSMRKVAQALGVEAMSLYNHVKNKDDLLMGMVDHVMGQVTVPQPRSNWKGEMRKRARGMRAVYLAHPWVPMLMVSMPNTGENVLGLVEATLGVLTEAGFDLIAADHAWNAMDSHIYGFVLQELNFPFTPESYADVAAQNMHLIPQETFPNLHAMAAIVAERKYDGLHDFDMGLDLILNGLSKTA